MEEIYIKTLRAVQFIPTQNTDGSIVKFPIDLRGLHIAGVVSLIRYLDGFDPQTPGEFCRFLNAVFGIVLNSCVFRDFLVLGLLTIAVRDPLPPRLQMSPQQ